MIKRPRARLTNPPQNYFVSEKRGISFVHTGCTLLDLALGGGYPLGRITNIVGDKSTAKTALATEALINFIQVHPKGAARYCESEAAYDRDYAAAMGLPVALVDFGDGSKPIVTVEDFSRDFDSFLDQQKASKKPGIYVLDSLDALSDEAEMEREVGAASYGTAKAKQLSEFFRKSARKQEQAQVLLLVISQVRDNIGALYGDKQKRSGGRALDFYASQVIYLAHLKTVKKTIDKVERAIGIDVRAKIKKNKVGLPFRECDFTFSFGFGIDDAAASILWLSEIGRTKDAGFNVTDTKSYIRELSKLSSGEYREECSRLGKVVKQVWAEVETKFLPTRLKYPNEVTSD
mgnify:CR=1 FL=1